MNLQERIKELQDCLNSSHSKEDWAQEISSEPSEYGELGSPEILAMNKETGKTEHICRVYDHGNRRLVLSMRKHIEYLIQAVESKE